jgi:hypothetical protein
MLDVSALARRLQSPMAAALACAGLLLPAMPARAIPEAEAQRKLSVVPVFILTSPEGTPLPIPQDNGLVLPMYLEQARAQKELEMFRQSNPTVQARVLPVPLNIANEKVAEINSRLKDKKLLAPVIVNDDDFARAVQMLKRQGVPDKDISEGLSVPVFFSKPFITVNTPKGTKAVFFLSYADAERAAARLKDTKVELLAADITVALQQMVQQQQDSFLFYPTQAFFELMQQPATAGKGGVKAPAAAPR